ncbi:sugar phosphate isomerase/epimerase [Halorubrum sp. CSM-61]|uniref:sugar phosphate isomerase/epimerase family protein n=1 Tax=Halorubrum sp. CSM-61 TaxID=2485838 RepID=UPI000F4BB993|nr:sugar phosphate isomerase/epimerase [Halorubrum sp. CSM-61]
MSNSTQSDAEETSSNETLSTNRRRVLQGIGATGVVGVAGASSVQARQPPLDNASIHGEEDEIAIGNQFWTYNENSDMSVAELIRESADAGYDMVEPFQFDDNEAISTALEEADIEMGSAHVGVGQLEDNDELIQTMSDFGVNHLVHAYQGPDTFSDEDALEEFAGRLNDVADTLAEEDILYGYHNHNHEFEETIGDTPAFDVFVENLNDNVHLQIDAGWVLTGGYDPINYIQKYSDRTFSIHMKNMADGEFYEIDEGDVSMEAVATVARNAAEVDYLIYEYDAAPEPMESLQTGAEWLERLNSRPHYGGICGTGSDTHPALL